MRPNTRRTTSNTMRARTAQTIEPAFMAPPWRDGHHDTPANLLPPEAVRVHDVTVIHFPKGNTMCEADDRNRQALFVLENEWGCGRIDVGRIRQILRGEDCDHAECGEEPLARTG
jgi:hypothetical protein